MQSELVDTSGVSSVVVFVTKSVAAVFAAVVVIAEVAAVEVVIAVVVVAVVVIDAAAVAVVGEQADVGSYDPIQQALRTRNGREERATHDYARC